MSDTVETQPAAPPLSGSYRDILRSTALLGASSVVVMALSLVRMKAIALLLGPAGVGLFALYNSVADLATAIAGMGVQQSGVRQIAEATSSGDHARIAATVAAIKQASIILGLLGATTLALFCVPISTLTFGSADQAFPIALLGIVVLLRLYAGGQTALVHGARRLGDLARLSIYGVLASVLITVPLVYLWGHAAIVPSLVLMTLAASLVSWWYARRIAVGAAPLGRILQLTEAKSLLRLGFAFMVSGFLTMGAAYAIRIIVLHSGGLHAAGIYQAAWAVSGLYVGFVLQAMGTDFYPRLTGVAKDDVAVTQLVNEQTQISLLLAGPGVIGTITLAPLAMAVFYSPEFAEAAAPLRWLCVGMMLRVVAWPMGYIVLAKGWQTIFIATEVGATVIHVGLAALLMPLIGVDGAAIAFCGLYACHTLIIYAIVRTRCAFRWSMANGKLISAFIPLTAASLAACALLPFWPGTAVSSAITAGAIAISLYNLSHIASAGLPPKIRKMVDRAFSVRPSA